MFFWGLQPVNQVHSKHSSTEAESQLSLDLIESLGPKRVCLFWGKKQKEREQFMIKWPYLTMFRDLKATLLEVEKERDRERLESKRKINGMKSAFTDEQDDTKKQITDLQVSSIQLEWILLNLLQQTKDSFITKDRNEHFQVRKVEDTFSGCKAVIWSNVGPTSQPTSCDCKINVVLTLTAKWFCLCSTTY